MSCSLLIIFSTDYHNATPAAVKKNVRKKGKTTVDGGSVGMGRQEPSLDNVYPELDTDRAMTMKAHPQKFQVTASSSRHVGLTKPNAPAKPPAQEKSRKKAPWSTSAKPPNPISICITNTHRTSTF